MLLEFWVYNNNDEFNTQILSYSVSYEQVKSNKNWQNKFIIYNIKYYI